ncbi:hypothetical protein P280DRAFT_174815 [Massarina eburnea CBS 473.64]|uniref:Uncharacterized protein n=1 Tax=Massarina eburnea CBS 473.64 TaxID=1395130 RepID=A0A6A6S9N3_9PLEO|nr:hypothetical protein P280DRAFT_174815 [Massarina eburnea CBS 473.64]
MPQIQRFHMSMMALRRNPYRKCKKEGAADLTTGNRANERGNSQLEETGRFAPGKMSVTSLLNEDAAGSATNPRRLNRESSTTKPRRKTVASADIQSQQDPFPLFHLPRELRNHIYSYLVVQRGRRIPTLEAKTILREHKKRHAAQRTRERLNLKRTQTGRRPISPKEAIVEPVVHLNISRASKSLHFEASECFYQSNWFAISIDSLPATTIETPSGWDYSRITRMQLELQLKDSQRMNSYIDWAPFFAMFPRLRFLRIIPSFHPRYYDWAFSELSNWDDAHYIFRAFFALLLASIPEQLILKLGSSVDAQDDMRLEGKTAVSKQLLWDMYSHLGTRRDANGQTLFVNQVVDWGEAFGPAIGVVGRCNHQCRR